ncbi:hypothetical protein OROGR_014899 [Orobanche gracilis]
MKSGKGHHEEDYEEEDEFGAKKDTTASANSSKEIFQTLRELIPNSDQKRDTASFLFEVIQYVQFLQEKVQKYEGSYQPWSSEPTKLMPWRNSHWRNFSGQPQTTKNGSGPGLGPPLPIRLDENGAAGPTTAQLGLHNPIEPGHTELPNGTTGVHLPLQATKPVTVASDSVFSHSLHHGPPSDAQLTECVDVMNLQDELMIEGGTISISSVYSQRQPIMIRLLGSLTQALQNTGVDLSQASISVQINLGKRAHRGSTAGISIAKDHGDPIFSGNQPVGTFQDVCNIEDLDQAQKRRKI